MPMSDSQRFDLLTKRQEMQNRKAAEVEQLLGRIGTEFPGWRLSGLRVLLYKSGTMPMMRVRFGLEKDGQLLRFQGWGATRHLAMMDALDKAAYESLPF